MAADGTVVLYSAGHGNRTLPEFLALLAAPPIAAVVDVRVKPASRRHPHFAREKLAAALAEQGIEYVFEGKDLGGFRAPKPDSRHSALPDGPFRGYADHMESEAFRRAISRLLAIARGKPTAFLCAERFPADCHRALIADDLVARGASVVHLVESDVRFPHRLNESARMDGDRLVYDAGRGRQRELRW